MKSVDRTEESRTVRLGDAEVNFRLRAQRRGAAVSACISTSAA